MTPADLEAFRRRMGYRRKDLGAALEISQDRLRRLLDGRSPIPRHIALACSALALGVPPIGAPYGIYTEVDYDPIDSFSSPPRHD